MEDICQCINTQVHTNIQGKKSQDPPGIFPLKRDHNFQEKTSCDIYAYKFIIETDHKQWLIIE